MNLPPVSIVYLIGTAPTLPAALHGLLESVGLRTLACADIDAFLTAYQPDRPGCVLLDAQIPGNNGCSVQQCLRQQDIDVPVLLIASGANVAMAVSALRQGALDFIEKPFNDQMLLDSVHHALTVDTARRRVRAHRQDVLLRFNTVTVRELEVLRCVVEGLSNQAIAEKLNLSHKTVEAHRAKVMQKMQADTLAHLMRMAMTIGIFKLYDVDASSF